MLQKSARNLKDMIANPNAVCPNFFVGRRNPKSELPLSENDVILSLKTVSDSYAYVTRFARRGLIRAPLQYTDFATTR